MAHRVNFTIVVRGGVILGRSIVSSAFGTLHHASKKKEEHLWAHFNTIKKCTPFELVPFLSECFSTSFSIYILNSCISFIH